MEFRSNQFVFRLIFVFSYKYQKKRLFIDILLIALFMANRKIILSEAQIRRLISEGIITEIASDDIDGKIAKALKNNKDLNKMVKKIISKSINTLFKTLWQRSGFFENEIEK